MKKHFVLAGMLALAGAISGLAEPLAPVSEAEALRIGWPQLAGPYGTFSATPIDTPLVADLSKAKKIWESTCTDLGRAKGGSQAYRRVDQFTAEAIAKMGGHPGSWAGVIVGDGTIFAASWRPCGDPVEVQGNKVRLDAEDFVVAIDPATGKTKWQTCEAGGILKGGGKRQGFQVGPAYYQGVVFALGSTARLYAFDAATGEKKWESDVHPARGAQQKAREAALAGLKDGKFSYSLTPDWNASLAVIGGVLIVPDAAGGLLGVNVATGEKLWYLRGVISRWATPSAWRNEDREYLVAANEKGELRLIDPADGKELWKMTGLGPNWMTLTPGKSCVLVNVVPNSGDLKGKPRVSGRYGAIRLSLTGGEKIWEAPADHALPMWMDTGARNRVLYQNGRFLLLQVSTSMTDPAKPGVSVTHTSGSYLLDETTGKVLASLPAEEDEDAGLGGLAYWCGDRVIARGDSAHGPTHGGRHPWTYWSTAGDTLTKLPGTMDLGEFTNGYEVFMEVPLVAGLMFERTEKGTLVCYDLRAKD